MYAERDSGLMSAPESELLHEVVRLRNALAAADRKRIELENELATLRTTAVLYMAWQHQRQMEAAS